MTPNRIVATLAPVLAIAAGACATWLAENFPGVDISAGALNEIFIAGAVIVLAPALQWIHGWQKHEARQADAELAVEKAEAGVADVSVVVASEDDEDEDEDLPELDLGGDDDLQEILAELEADEEEPVPAG